MKKVKGILFNFDLVGTGIVNFDNKDQRFQWNQLSGKPHCKYDNVNFAKKNWYKDENGELTYKVKISSDCLRNAIFKTDFQCQSPNIADNELIFLIFLSSPASILRGYQFTTKVYPYKKKSTVTITDAEQTCDAVSNIEIGSTSGLKITDENKSDTTLHYHESVGNIKYSGAGAIDLKELQFLSMDQVFDRMALNSDLFDNYSKFLKTKLPSFNSTPKYYYIDGTSVKIPELGVVFSDEDVVTLVKEFFKRLLSLNISRRNSYAKIYGLKIKFIYDCTVDTLNENENWITIKNESEVPEFEPENFYVEEVDFDKAKELRFAFEKAIEDRKTKNKEDKAEKLAKSKKAKSTTDETEE